MVETLGPRPSVNYTLKKNIVKEKYLFIDTGKVKELIREPLVPWSCWVWEGSLKNL